MNRYTNIKKSKTEIGRRYIFNAMYPDIPATANDTYVITTGGDRYDTLAQQFYGDKSLWWIISTANPGSNTDSLSAKPGIQLRIPANPQTVIDRYNTLNRIR